AIISTVDDWGQYAARIKSALKSVEGDTKQYDNLQNRFLEISNRNGKAIEITQDLYIGAAKSMQELGYSTTQTVDYIESLSSSLTANSTSSLKTDSAINALGKSMLVGKVAGDNFKAVMEAMPSLLDSLATQIEKTNGGIKVTTN
uniref:tape measure protein n=2 Tax=Providencia TaxID=586 RepID=UPI00111D31B9